MDSDDDIIMADTDMNGKDKVHSRNSDEASVGNSELTDDHTFFVSNLLLSSAKSASGLLHCMF